VDLLTILVFYLKIRYVTDYKRVELNNIDLTRCQHTRKHGFCDHFIQELINEALALLGILAFSPNSNLSSH